MTANVTVKHKDKTPIGIEEVSELMEFCDAMFGMRSNSSYVLKLYKIRLNKNAQIA